MSEKTVDINKARESLSELLMDVASGNEIVLTENDQPRARLVPLAAKTVVERTPGLHAGNIQVSPDFDAPLSDEFWLGSE